MSTDLEVISEVYDGLVEGIMFYTGGQYDGGIDKLRDVIISAGLAMQQDPELGEACEFGRAILVAKGYQLSAYADKAAGARPEQGLEIRGKMEQIARGELNPGNSYFWEIIEALEDWGQPIGADDFYHRKL